MKYAPANAAGTEPTDSQRTRVQLTVPWRTCTPPPTGFRKNDATTSEEIAADGVTWKMITSTGVMRAPPPMPVRPMMQPTMRPASAMSHCTGCAPTFRTGIIDKIETAGHKVNGPGGTDERRP